MSKVAIMTDSNSGMTQMHAKEIGITVVPMPFDINGQQYFEDIVMRKILPIVLSVSLAIACIVLGFVKGIYVDEIQRKTLNIW